MDQRNTRLEARIHSIKMNFVASLPSHIVELGNYWKVLRHTGWDVHAAQELQSLAHRLAGSGGTFGFTDISRTAAVLDVSLGEALQLGDNVTPEKTVLLEIQVNDLLIVLNAALNSSVDASAELPVLTSRVSEDKGLVVVIDDDEFLCERIVAVLEEVGYRVATFAEPPKAIALLQEEQPVLVLLDLMFPGQRWPAFEVIADIRGETAQRTPVIVMSGHADFRSRLQATRAGADAYLVKPLEDNYLIETVTQLASRPSDDNWRCLVVDDDELLARQLVEWLREAGMVAEWVSAPRHSWLKVREFRPDVLVLDVNMPECNGIEFATMLRQDVNTAQLPIVFLTSERAERTRRDAMAAGADDYLLKPIGRQALIEAVIARARLGKRIQGQVSRVIQQSSQGNGLSRHFFFSEFERVIDEATEGSVQAALVLVGLVSVPDVLKQHGALGIAALQAQLLTRLGQSGVPTWSMLGENIVGLLLPRDASAGHQGTVKKLLAQLSAKPYQINQLDINSGACAAILHLRSGQSAPAAILLQAEQMLSIAIETGVGSVLEGFVGTAEAVEATGRLPVNRLRIAYQPIVTMDAANHALSMVLARLSDEEGNLLPAGKFLSALEKRGWVPELDTWVFRQAHSVLTKQIAEDEAHTLIVHASPRSLSSTIYLETVLAILVDHPMRQPHQSLVIAISEITVVTHRDMVERLNNALVAAGGGLMITHYGASANAVDLVHKLRPRYVRLDDALTRRLEQSEYKAADRVIIEAAEAVKAIIVASGIENASSLSGLWSKGIRWFQGYFIQEPSAVLVEPEAA